MVAVLLFDNGIDAGVAKDEYSLMVIYNACAGEDSMLLSVRAEAYVRQGMWQSYDETLYGIHRISLTMLRRRGGEGIIKKIKTLCFECWIKYP